MSTESDEPVKEEQEQEQYIPTERGLLSWILLSMITFGIYGWYRIYKFAKDVNIVCDGDGESTGGLLKVIFFGIITLGIYHLIWLYMVGDRLKANAPKYGLSFNESGGTLLLWFILGSFIVVGPFITLHIMVKNSNALIRAYNSK